MLASHVCLDNVGHSLPKQRLSGLVKIFCYTDPECEQWDELSNLLLDTSKFQGNLPGNAQQVLSQNLGLCWTFLLHIRYKVCYNYKRSCLLLTVTLIRQKHKFNAKYDCFDFLRTWCIYMYVYINKTFILDRESAVVIPTWQVWRQGLC